MLKFSVAYTFEPGIISELARYPQVREVFGKLDKDIIGGGRSTYTLRKTTKKKLINSIQDAHANKIRFNYLLNGSHLNGIEQTRWGHRKIRTMLDFLSSIEVDSITVASPFLLRLIKRQYSHFSVRVSAFACVDSSQKAYQWEQMGADNICLSAIACNRNFELLGAIKNKVSCDLQLIVNASCLQNCAYELTHMNMLTQSSRNKDHLKGFCVDYCFLFCSCQRLLNPVNFIRSVWIRPEDLFEYEKIGFENFKILERSCPGDLLLRRVKAYAEREFKGNLLELVAPVAQIKRELGMSFTGQLRMIKTMFRPTQIKPGSLRKMEKYASHMVLHKFDKQNAAIYIDNSGLDSFLKGIRIRNCLLLNCEECGYCHKWASRVVYIDDLYKKQGTEMAEDLNLGLESSSLWM